MQQPNTLVSGHGIGPPHKVFTCHHDTKTLLGSVRKIIGHLKQAILCRLGYTAEFHSMRGLAISRKASHISPTWNFSRCAIRLICRVASRHEEFRAGKHLFVFEPTIGIGPRSHIGRIIEHLVRVLNAPSIGLLGSLQANACIGRVERFINACRHSHHRRKVKSRRRPLTDNIKRIGILSRHHVTRESKCGQLVVNTTIGSLHGKHPVKIPLDFGKQVRQVAFGRNIPLERLEIIGEMFVKRKERIGGDTRVHDVAAIVAGIVPTLARIDRSRGTCRAMEPGSRVRMSCGTFPLIGVSLIQSHGGSLIVIPFQ